MCFASCNIAFVCCQVIKRSGYGMSAPMGQTNTSVDIVSSLRIWRQLGQNAVKQGEKTRERVERRKRTRVHDKRVWWRLAASLTQKGNIR